MKMMSVNQPVRYNLAHRVYEDTSQHIPWGGSTPAFSPVPALSQALGWISEGIRHEFKYKGKDNESRKHK